MRDSAFGAGAALDLDEEDDAETGSFRRGTCCFAFLLLFMAADEEEGTEGNCQMDLSRNRMFPTPLLTDMLSDWPILSSICMGAGPTLLSTSMASIAAN